MLKFIMLFDYCIRERWRNVQLKLLWLSIHYCHISIPEKLFEVNKALWAKAFETFFFRLFFGHSNVAAPKHGHQISRTVNDWLPELIWGYKASPSSLYEFVFTNFPHLALYFNPVRNCTLTPHLFQLLLFVLFTIVKRSAIWYFAANFIKIR